MVNISKIRVLNQRIDTSMKYSLIIDSSKLIIFAFSKMGHLLSLVK